MRLRRPQLLPTLLPALVLTACAATGQGSPRLELTARSLVLSGEDVGLAVRASDALGAGDLLLTVAVDDRRVEGDWKLSRGAASFRIPAAALGRQGVHEILVKCGSERTTVAIRVLSIGRVFEVAAVSTAIAVLAMLMVARALRRARPSAG